MSNREHLFNLIHSMNRNEKGYFKKMYSDKGMARSNKYVELFGIIENQKKYDEVAITQHFENQKIFKQLSVAKNYLTSMIMKSMRAYFSKSSINMEINERMMNIEILFERALYPAVIKEVKKVEKMIDEHEAFNRYPELSRWKKNIMDKTSDQRKVGQLRQSIHAKELVMMEKTRVFAEISNLTFQFLSIYLKTGPVRNKAQLKEYQRVMKHPILRDESKLNSFGSWYYFHNVHSMYFETIRDYNNFHYHTDCFVKLVEEHPRHIQRNPSVYLTSCFNRLLSLTKLKDEIGFEKALEHFQEIPNKWSQSIPADLKKDLWVYEANATMWFLHSKGDFDKMHKLGQEIEDRTTNQVFIYPFSVLYSETIYMTTYASFAIGNYKDAIKKLNLIINNSLKEQREDIACYAMILNMMCHYELGNYDYVESSVRSTYRFLVKLEKIHKFEKILISFFRKLMRLKVLNNLDEHMLAFRKQLLEIEKDRFEKTALEYLDLISWLTSHIEKRPFKEVTLLKIK